MSNLLTGYEEKQLEGISGLQSSIQNLVYNLPSANCPLLRTSLDQIEVLSNALHILTLNFNKILNQE